MVMRTANIIELVMLLVGASASLLFLPDAVADYRGGARGCLAAVFLADLLHRPWLTLRLERPEWAEPDGLKPGGFADLELDRDRIIGPVGPRRNRRHGPPPDRRGSCHGTDDATAAPGANGEGDRLV